MDPLPLTEMRSALDRAALGEWVLRGAVGTSALGDDNSGLGRFLNIAVDLRASPSLAAGFFAVRQPPVFALVVTSDIVAGEVEGVISVRAARQKMAGWESAT